MGNWNNGIMEWCKNRKMKNWNNVKIGVWDNGIMGWWKIEKKNEKK